MHKYALAIAAMTALASFGANAADFSLGGRVGLSGAGI